MVDLLLIYPYFNDDNSIFKFPPLGLGYIASYARSYGYSVALIDCTFMKEDDVIAKAKSLEPKVTGIYSMISMKDTAFRIAKRLRGYSDYLIAGGPLPTTIPKTFLHDFDIVVMGEGEETVLEILTSLDKGKNFSKINGIAYKEEKSLVLNALRAPIKDLNSLPFPARDLYDHSAYKEYFQKYHGYTITSMVTSRGCPFECDFCSRPIFSKSYRGRTATNIVDEMETVLPYSYDEIWIADDIFPISKRVGISVCNEIIKRGLDIPWECLCRADIMNREIALKMKKANCHRVFFGLESGNNQTLRVMNKMITVEQAKRAVETIKSVGIKAGAFFIIGYPGETNDTMLDTIKFASSLPLDYQSFTVPYPIPGTRLYEKLKSKIEVDEWKKPKYDPFRHVLLYKSEFSMHKLKFGIMKADIQHFLRTHLGHRHSIISKPFEAITNQIFKLMR